MPAVRVESTPVGYRLVATTAFAGGDVVLLMQGIELTSPTRYTVQIGPGVHLAPENYTGELDQTNPCLWMYTNHSCTPNTFIRNRSLIALLAIDPGDEITFDYETTEFEMAEPFECNCGSPGCRRTIRGYRFREETPGGEPKLETAACLSDSTPDAEDL